MTRPLPGTSSPKTRRVKTPLSKRWLGLVTAPSSGGPALAPVQTSPPGAGPDVERHDLLDPSPRLIERAAAGDFEGAVGPWVCAGFAAYLAGAATLDVAFGLQGKPRTRSWRTRLAYERRKGLLRDAFAILAQEAGGSNWAVAGQLAAEIKKFSESNWPEWRDLESPPPGTSQLRTLLFRWFQAQDAKGKAGQSRKIIHEICTSHTSEATDVS